MRSITFSQLTDELRHRYGKGAHHASAVYREVFRNGNSDLRRAPEFSVSQKLIDALQTDLVFHLGRVTTVLSDNGVMKFITQLSAIG